MSSIFDYPIEEDIKNVDEYIRGVRDCKEGRLHEAGQDPDYDRGFAVQYEAEQVMAEYSR